MASALPRLWQMEREHGSLLKALRSGQAQSKSPVAAPRLCGLRGGLGQLMQAMARAIEAAGGRVRPLSAVKAIHPAEAGRGRYRVQLADTSLHADELILALPPPEAARLLSGLDGALSTLYAGIPMAPIVAISLGWPREQVPHPLDGFGFLVPRAERMRDGLRLLGALFMTSALPDFEQAPKGQIVIRAMYGGAHDPEVERMADGALLEQVQRDLRTTLGIWNEPRFIHIQRWPQAIEQYRLGHAARVAEIEARLSALGHLHATGAALHGVSVPDVLRNGQALGRQLADALPLA
jgi:protoporphyrinogen/coproporphyrinogen III oxidase